MHELQAEQRCETQWHPRVQMSVGERSPCQPPPNADQGPGCCQSRAVSPVVVAVEVVAEVAAVDPDHRRLCLDLFLDSLGTCPSSTIGTRWCGVATRERVREREREKDEFVCKRRNVALLPPLFDPSGGCGSRYQRSAPCWGRWHFASAHLW
jgi:hypothetical protein